MVATLVGAVATLVLVLARLLMMLVVARLWARAREKLPALGLRRWVMMPPLLRERKRTAGVVSFTMGLLQALVSMSV